MKGAETILQRPSLSNNDPVVSHEMRLLSGGFGAERNGAGRLRATDRGRHGVVL